MAIATSTPAPWPAPTASGPVTSSVRLPGSKSMTARALVLAAVSTGTSTLHAPLRARDTELMAAGLRALGAHVSTRDDELWTVRSRPPDAAHRPSADSPTHRIRSVCPVAC